MNVFVGDIPVGYWELVGSKDSYFIRFAMHSKPNWWFRFTMRVILGWKWRDAE